MKKILMISSEIAPFAKTGGLGDVLGALPCALSKNGCDVRAVMPKYGLISEKYTSQMEFLFYIYVQVGWRNKYCGVFKLVRDNVTYYFIDNEYYFGDSCIYKWNDLERFAFFDKAALEMLKKLDFQPDIIHCHDWQAGMIPLLLDAYYRRDLFYSGIKTVFTIHNLKYQGIYSIDAAADFFSLNSYYFTGDKLEFHGNANLLKAGIVYADIVTTVSPSYAGEIQTPLGGEGLNGLLSARSNSLFGILNGLDYEEYNPEKDEYIFKNYTKNNVMEGKRENKAELQKLLGLPVDKDKVMIGIVSRLVEQKGFDIIRDAMDELMSLDIELVILGTGEEKYENMLHHYAWCNPQKVSANITFSNELAHRIYAASDFFLMPSLFEPCGLSQLIAMAYGTLPIVRETGGLRDTVFSYNEETKEGNGFSFYPPLAHDMMFTIRRAIGFFSDKTLLEALIKRAMEQDFSWNESAHKYEEIYNRL